MKEKYKVNKETGCWEWQLGKIGSGYGALYVNGHQVLAHRFFYEQEKGEIPEGLFACHACDNPPCVNPEHIFIGTQSDNIMDATLKGRRGHKRSWELSPTRGELAVTARLNRNQVKEIRGLLGKISQREIARRFNVSFQCINHIAKGNTWSWLKD